VKICSSPGDILHQHVLLTERHLDPNRWLTAFMGLFMGDSFKNDPERARGMFYPVLPRNVSTVDYEHVHDFLRVMGDDLASAVTYEVTTEMQHVMEAVYDKTMTQVERIDEGELPEDPGFAWLDEGWTLTDLKSQEYTIRALSWKRCEAWTKGTEMDPLERPTLWPCIRVALWSHVADDVATGRMTAAQARQARLDLGSLQLTHCAVIPCGLAFRPPESLVEKRSSDSFLGLVHILWMFLQMEIVATPRAPVKPGWERRARRTIHVPEVRVVLLRRVKHITEPTGGHHEVDWSCRWIVQGHRRRLADGRVTWVRPYLKGPDGKPLRVTETVMRLAR